jgi:hypothetical protein
VTVSRRHAGGAAPLFAPLLFAALLLAAAPACAQQGQTAAPAGFYSAGDAAAPDDATPQGNEAIGKNAAAASQSYVVTTLDKCFDQLGPAEAAQIKDHSLHPYADCHSRLREKQQALQHYDAAATAAALTPVTPRNFVRVQTGPDNGALNAAGGGLRTAPANTGYHGGYWHADQQKSGGK